MAPPSAPQADSATEARQAYRRAVTAYRARDLATARREMARAAEWWPRQQVYLESSAALAAEAGDTADAARWIDRLAALGIGPNVAGDSTYRALLTAPSFQAAASRLVAATAPIERGRVRLTLSDSTLHPEGIAFDARRGTWFVGSVRQRRIVAVDRRGTARDFVAPAANGIAGVFGMAIDSSRRLLWVATTALARMEGYSAPDSGRAGVYAYDLDTGVLRRRVWLPRDGAAHTFGDVAVAPNGDVYASDSQTPWIFRLRAGDDSLERFLTHPFFRSLQGMAIAPDGRTMFVADYSHGLARVDLEARAVEALASPANVTLLGIDGLYMHRGALIAVQNGVTPVRVVRFCLQPDGRRVTHAEALDRNPALADEPTLATIAGDSVFYVATSQWDKFDDAGRRVPGTRLRSATVVGVDLASDLACR